MDVVRVTGTAAQTLDRDELERLRRLLRRAPSQAQESVPVCGAASTTLVLDLAGDAYACEATDRPLAKRRSQDLLRVFRGPLAEELRASLRAGELPGEHCHACIRCLRLDLPAQSAILRDHVDDPEFATPTGPHRLIVRLDRGARPKDDVALLRRITSVLDTVQRLELCADDVSTDPFADAVMALLDARPTRPALKLRTQRLESPEALVRSLRSLRPVRVSVSPEVDLARIAPLLASVLDTNGALVVRYLVGPSNWFDIARVATLAAAAGATLDLRGAEPDGHCPLLAAPLAEQRFVAGVLGSLWFLFARERRPASVPIDAFERLRAELRRRVEDHARGERDRDAAALLQGSDPITLPAIDHPLWDEAASAEALLGWLTGLENSPGLANWAAGFLARGDADALLNERPTARLMLQKAAVTQPTRETFAALLRTYTDPSSRKDRIEADRAFAARAGITGAADHWREWFGLARLVARKRPWRIPSASKPTAGDGVADVTVLVPSYGHERFVEECVRSALAQTHRWLVVHVVDDNSPDATAEHARSIRDPRLTVRVNPVNLGLGNSVLAALEHVTTPFVAILNSDDFLHPERIARCRQVLLDDEGAQLVTTDLALVDAEGGELSPENTSRLRDGRMIFDWVHWYDQARTTGAQSTDLFAELLRQNFLATSSNLFCRTDWLRARADALRSLEFCLDWHVFLTAAREGTLRHVAEPLAAYRLHGANTVWFRDGRRWRYFLEVNRVAAEALRDEIASGAADAPRLVAQIAQDLATNTETDGLALWLNTAVGGPELEALSKRDDGVRDAILALNDRAERLTRLGYAARAIGSERLESALGMLPRAHGLEASRLIGDLAREDARGFRDALTWTRRELDRVERRRAELDGELGRLRQREREASEQLAHALERAHVVLDRLRALGVGDTAAVGDPLLALEAGVQVAASLLTAQSDENRELMARVRKADDAARRETESLRTQLSEARSAHEHALATHREALTELGARLDESRRALRAGLEDLAGLSAQRALLETQLTTLRETTDAERAKAQARIETLLAESARFAVELHQLRAAMERATAETARVQTERDRLDAEKQAVIAERDRARSEKQAVAGERDRVRTEKQAVAADRDRVEQERRAAVTRGDQLEARLRSTAQELAELRQQFRGKSEELERLLKSPEWRIGYAFWRKTPLFAKSRRLVRGTWRRTRESSLRTMMFIKKLLGGRKSARTSGGQRPGLKVAAGATAHFPVLSHTFVYQELTAMHDMLGADVKVFHTENGDPAALHAAFQYLASNKEHLQPAWEVHKADYEHYKRTQPAKVDALLAEITKYSGIPRDQLEKRFELMLAFTYARRHAMWGAEYVHTYFFYDQALCGLVSSWMNEIPRGLSTYADHMLKDWPLKMVPLHLKTAAVIVATSRRIREELIQLGGPEVASKIVVKPNGTDGQRFRFVARNPVAGRPIELACVTRIEPKKGMLELAEAAKLLLDAGKRFRIHVIGSVDKGNAASEEYGARFEARIAELGVGDVVIRHGRMRQEELRPLLDRADAFVAPFVETETGDKDGIPTAILEAMATGLPIVATDSGSISETFDDGVEGLRVPQRDPAALARAITRLIEQPELAPRLGKRAKARFDREFDIRVAEPRLHERILAAIDARKPATR